MTASDVRQIRVADACGTGLQLLFANEIEGTVVSFIRLKEGESFEFDPCLSEVAVLMLCSGKASFSGVVLDQPGVFVQLPSKSVSVSALEECEILQLKRIINETEMSELDAGLFPLCVAFSEAPTYKEDCKSEKTTSRMIIPAKMIPRFAMGSVETSGDDLVAKHEHPMLEQFFFGLKGNDCDILIDDFKVPFYENHLVHIPLGSSHGVQSRGSQVIRYLWLDFLFDESSLEYMEKQHHMDE